MGDNALYNTSFGGRKMLDTRCWMLDAGYWMLVQRLTSTSDTDYSRELALAAEGLRWECWILDTRYWMLDAGTASDVHV